ncbi:MAG: PD40 domain-containing protein [candidate division Zixibacteria bacterium]|nr:PD40 domain-containing protein [candidate division Zixibacteria bacterium]
MKAIAIATTALTVILIGCADAAGPGSPKIQLNRDSTEIFVRSGENKRTVLLHVSDLADTVPMAFPHSADQRFDNQKFHHMAASPDGKWVAFVSGTDDQWLGVYNCEQQYDKFVVFGIQTRFYDLIWSPDSKYLAYGFKGPDQRLLIHLMEPQGKNDVRPKPMNGWQKLTQSNENLRLVGWKQAADTSFAFEVLDSLGRVSERQEIPLHRPAPPSQPSDR